jgi:hypothetical protein
MRIIVTTLLLLGFSQELFALDYRGRLGLGFTNQLQNDIPALSFKLQTSRSFAWGGLIGLNTDKNSGGFGVGLKAYKLFFEEPQLNFYGGLLAAYINQKQGNGRSQSGLQTDLTLGTEFALPQLKSIGLSFEFGLSVTKLDEVVIQTVGQHFVSAAVHFYF